MLNSQTSPQPARSAFRWVSLLQLVISALAALALLAAAALIVLTQGFQYFTQRMSAADLVQPFMVAASLAFLGVLMLPSAWYAWLNLAKTELEPIARPEPRGAPLILTLVVLVLVTSALLLGNWVYLHTQLSWLLLPPLNIIANGLPALWIIYIGTRKLIQGAPQRRWGVFAIGLVPGPLLILILELVMLAGLGIFVLIWASINPTVSSQLNSLVSRLQSAAPNQDAILQILLPYLLNPVILLVTLAFISVLVPLVEEAFKPIGVWFLAGKKLSPAQGFAYGVLSGAGFGLFENLGNTSSGGEAWALLASTRITTLMLHSLTAGLMGWALVSAWTQRRYLRLVITYVFAVAVHGLWNGMAVLSLFSSIEGLPNVSVPAILIQLGSLSTVGVIALGVFNFILYISFSSMLRNYVRAQKASVSPASPENGFLQDISTPFKPNEFVNPLDKDTNPPSRILEGHPDIPENDPQNPHDEGNPPNREVNP